MSDSTLGDGGKSAIRTVFSTQLGNSANDLRLRAVVVQALYGDPYGPKEVIGLVQASFTSQEPVPVGILWSLAEAVPEQDLPAILDGIEPPESDDTGVHRRNWEAESFYARILVRAWPVTGPFDALRVLSWLFKRAAFERTLGRSRANELRAAIRATPKHLWALAEAFFDQVPIDENRWLAFHRFREAVLFELQPDDLAGIVTRIFDASEAASERRLFLYEVALSLSFQIEHPRGTAVYADLYQRADDDPTLRKSRDESAVTNLPASYFGGRSGWAAQSQDNRARERGQT